MGTEAEAAPRVGQYVEVSPGIELYYEDIGEGRPLVFIPGWTFTTRVFDHQIAAFSRTHRVIAYDPRSQGRSTVTLEGNNYATHAKDLAALLERLNIEKPVLVCWSAGSDAAWHYIRNNGTDGLSGMVNIDMPLLGMSTNDDDWVEGSIEGLSGFFQGVQSFSGLRETIIWYAENVMIEQEMSPELTAWIAQQSLSTPPLIAANLLADFAFSNHVEDARLVDATIPALHCVAAHWADKAKPFLARHCPASRFESFGGHMMFWEYPDRFNDLLKGFLDGIEH